MNRHTMLTAMIAATLFGTVSGAQNAPLPTREGPRPETTEGVPHVQLGIAPDQAVSEEMLRRVAAFPGVTLAATRVSLPGAVGFHLDGDVSLANPQAIVGGREFAHLHPDGSLHAALSPVAAEEAITAGWAVAHPWAQQREGWEGFVMIYTPRNQDELAVVMRLIAASFTYITGTDLP